MNNEKINKAVSDYPGLIFASRLILEVKELIPFKENKYEWLDAVIESKILDCFEERELGDLIEAL